MGHAVDLAAFEKVSDCLVVGRVGFHYLLDESYPVDLVHLDLGLFVHEEPDKGIAVGVKAVGGDCEDGVALFDRTAVDDFASFNDARDA